MEDNNLEFPFVFPKESKPVISIIGIGVDRYRVKCVWYEQKRNGGTVITA